jgi:hypothetical protein
MDMTQRKPRFRRAAVVRQTQSGKPAAPSNRIAPDGALRFSADILKALDRVLGPRN